jgi:hypothetical protein
MRIIGSILIALLLCIYARPARADGRGLEIAGATLTAIGGASFVSGAGVMLGDMAAPHDHHCGCGGPGALVYVTTIPFGGALLIAGIPMLVVGYKRAHKQERVALAPNQLSLHF